MLTEPITLEINTNTITEHSRVTIPLLVQKKEKRISANAKERLEIVGSDAQGTLVINFWDNIDQMDNQIQEGHIYNFSGMTKEYNNRIDMNGKYVQEILDNKAKFVPRYNITSTDFNMFECIYNYLPDSNQKLISYLIGYKGDISLWNKFISTPLTERNAYNKLGGLFMHTLYVCKLISKIIKNYPSSTNINVKRLITKSILHDISKMELFVINENTFSIKKIETQIEDNILSGMAILNANKDLGLFSKEEIDNIAYGVMSHKGEFGSMPIKSIEDSILYHANLIDMEIKTNNIFTK